MDHQGKQQGVAERVYQRIRTMILPLDRFPLMGRLGREPGTRELVVTGFPYIIVYELQPGGVLVLSIVHGTMRWPPA